MQYLLNENNAKIVQEIVTAIHANANLLSQIDGETGDGDHGVNMNKGFLMAGERISDEDSFSEALKTLGRTLFMEHSFRSYPKHSKEKEESQVIFLKKLY